MHNDQSYKHPTKLVPSIKPIWQLDHYKKRIDAERDMRLELPYCFHKLPSGHWLPLNRSYLPLGWNRRRVAEHNSLKRGDPFVWKDRYDLDDKAEGGIAFLNYSEVEEALALPAEAIRHDALYQENDFGIWMYSDFSEPWRSQKHLNDYWGNIQTLLTLGNPFDHDTRKGYRIKLWERPSYER